MLDVAVEKKYTVIVTMSALHDDVMFRWFNIYMHEQL